jgi:hypothetical protein
MWLWAIDLMMDWALPTKLSSAEKRIIHEVATHYQDSKTKVKVYYFDILFYNNKYKLNMHEEKDYT